MAYFNAYTQFDTNNIREFHDTDAVDAGLQRIATSTGYLVKDPITYVGPESESGLVEGSLAVGPARQQIL